MAVFQKQFHFALVILAFSHFTYVLLNLLRSFVTEDMRPFYVSPYPRVVPCSTRGSQRGSALRILTSRAAPRVHPRYTLCLKGSFRSELLTLFLTEVKARSMLVVQTRFHVALKQATTSSSTVSQTNQSLTQYFCHSTLDNLNSRKIQLNNRKINQLILRAS